MLLGSESQHSFAIRLTFFGEYWEAPGRLGGGIFLGRPKIDLGALWDILNIPWSKSHPSITRIIIGLPFSVYPHSGLPGIQMLFDSKGNARSEDVPRSRSPS